MNPVDYRNAFLLGYIKAGVAGIADELLRKANGHGAIKREDIREIAHALSVLDERAANALERTQTEKTAPVAPGA